MSMSEVINSIEREMFDRATKRICGNCKWREDFNGVCFNGNSDECAGFTDKDFSCDCHEFKENKNDK